MHRIRGMLIKDRVREYVLRNFYVDGATLSDSDSLLERGVIDSTGVMEIIQFVESEFGVRVADTEIVPENLDSIAGIGAYVLRKLETPRVAAAG